VRQTRKLVTAISLYHDLGLSKSYDSQDELYSLLNECNHFWNSQEKRWVDGGTPDPPTNAIWVRVMSDAKIVSEIASVVAEAIAPYEIDLIDRSDLYPCRPPKQNDARVYLTFKGRDRKSI
jgi:hypothetical protein